MKPSKHNNPEPPQSAPALRTRTPEPTLEQICERANILYLARHGIDGLALTDWLRAEQQLKREFELCRNSR